MPHTCIGLSGSFAPVKDCDGVRRVVSIIGSTPKEWERSVLQVRWRMSALGGKQTLAARSLRRFLSLIRRSTPHGDAVIFSHVSAGPRRSTKRAHANKSAGS